MKDSGNFKHDIDFGGVTQYYKVTRVRYRLFTKQDLHPTSSEEPESLLL